LQIRSAEGKPERYLPFATELVALKVDVIVASGGTPAALSAKQATGTLPIVVVGVGDPVACGLGTSLARPGGNVTVQRYAHLSEDHLRAAVERLMPSAQATGAEVSRNCLTPASQPAGVS
jgi:ABC-type uncharacterized transport system substrate-binding protein